MRQWSDTGLYADILRNFSMIVVILKIILTWSRNTEASSRHFFEVQEHYLEPPTPSSSLWRILRPVDVS